MEDPPEETPWYRRWDGEPDWLRKPLPWAKHIRPWRPLLLALALLIGAAGLAAGEPGAAVPAVGSVLLVLFFKAERRD